MDRAELLDTLTAELGKHMQPGRQLKVGIDGRCASGKTTLADELAAILRTRGFEVLRRPVDHYHHPPERRYAKANSPPAAISRMLSTTRPFGAL